MKAAEQDDLYHPRGTDSYPVRTRVRVLRGERKGQVGRIDATWADGGDMVHRVRFDDGTTETYDVDEITPNSSYEPNRNVHND